MIDRFKAEPDPDICPRCDRATFCNDDDSGDEIISVCEHCDCPMFDSEGNAIPYKPPPGGDDE